MLVKFKACKEIFFGPLCQRAVYMFIKLVFPPTIKLFLLSMKASSGNLSCIVCMELPCYFVARLLIYLLDLLGLLLVVRPKVFDERSPAAADATE